MAANTLNILRPSVNNLTVRIFMRAAGLDFEELDVWGKTTSPEYLEKYPAHLTPMLEDEGLPKGALGESCAIMQYLCNKHGLDQFYPTDPGERAMVDNAMFYLIGTFYPLVTRATYPTLGFAQYPGEVGTSDADDEMKERAQKDAEAALAEPLDVYRAFFLAGKPFIGGDTPSIADFRLAATLEFLRAIDYEFPAWANEYMTRMETTLGDAYSEPAADVRHRVARAPPVLRRVSSRGRAARFRAAIASRLRHAAVQGCLGAPPPQAAPPAGLDAGDQPARALNLRLGLPQSR
jgi:glutathione S-transferase